MNGAHYKTLLKKGNWHPVGDETTFAHFTDLSATITSAYIRLKKGGPLKKSSWIGGPGEKSALSKPLLRRSSQPDNSWPIPPPLY